MAVTLPQVKVFQDFEIVPTAVENPLNAFLVGGLASLIRYTEEDEKELGASEYYNPESDTSLSYPSRSIGAVVDRDSVKLWSEQPLLEYFNGASVPGAVTSIVDGSRNRVTNDIVNFTDNGDFKKNAALLDRGALVGDTVRLQMFPDGEDPVTLWTSIRGFAGDVVPAVVSPALAYANNPQDQIASSLVTQTAGTATAFVVNNNYDGFTDNALTQTYTVTVLIGGNDIADVRLKVSSSDGRDNQTVTQADENGTIPIGTRGLTIDADVGTAFEAGQVFEIYVQQDFTASQATSGGTYTGSETASYWVRVIKSARLPEAGQPSTEATTALLQVYSNISDTATNVEVTNRDTDVVIGKFGVTFQALNDMQRNSYFIIRATPPVETNVRTLILSHNIPDGIASDTAVTMSLYISQDALEISQIRPDSGGLPNYTVEDDKIVTTANMVVYDSSWTSGGSPVALPLSSAESIGRGRLYIEYRQWLTDYCGIVSAIDDVADLGTIPGPLDVLNPLKWGLFKALQNSNGTTVYFSGVCDVTDAEEWSDALGIIQERNDVYNLVPLSNDATVQGLFAAHANTQSAAEQGRWRVAWVTLSGVSTVPIVHTGTSLQGHTFATTINGEEAIASVVDNDSDEGDEFTRLTVTTGNGGFDTNGVRAKDIVRINYAADAFGNETYEEYVVASVNNEDELILASSLETETIVPVRIEIWRNLSRDEEAAEIASRAGSWATRRVRAVWPDLVGSGGQIMEGYYMCAALAGLSAGILPQQGMTNLEISGFDDVSRSNERFTRAQLDVMASSGTWIVTQSTQDNSIYTRHALTTGDNDDLNAREEALTRNVDSLSYRFQSIFEPFIGVTNVTPLMIEQVRTRALSLISIIQSEGLSVSIGSQILAAEVTEVRQHAIFLDRIVVVIRLSVPYPLNNLEISLVV